MYEEKITNSSPSIVTPWAAVTTLKHRRRRPALANRLLVPFILAALAFVTLVPNSPMPPRSCFCLDVTSGRFKPCACTWVEIWRIPALGNWGGAIAGAADLDPRAELTIKLSPAECVLVENRVDWPGTKDAPSVVTSDAESEARARISKACDFAGLAAKTEAAQKAKKQPDYSGPRVSRKLARDAFDTLLAALTPTKPHPVEMQFDGALRQIRLELREVLAGRDPYGATK